MKFAFVRTPLTFASLAAAALMALPAAAAPVSLHDRAQLDAALRDGPPCCVVDARPAGWRALRPLPDALVYRKGMKIIRRPPLR